MKEVKVTKEVVYTRYQAIDGTMFDSEEECSLYESTAKAVINSRFNKLIVKEANKWDLMGGNEDDIVYIVKMTSQEDADTVKQRYFLDNSFLLKDNYCSQRQDIEDKIDKAYNEGDYLLLGMNCENYMYMLNTLSYYIQNLTI